MYKLARTLAKNGKNIEKLKVGGSFVACKRQKAEYVIARQKRLKGIAVKMSDSQQRRTLRKNQLQILPGVRKYIVKKPLMVQSKMVQTIRTKYNLLRDNNPSNDTAEPSISSTGRIQPKLFVSKQCPGLDTGFESEEELNKAVAKIERALPKSPAKRKAVIMALFRSFSEEDQQDIIRNLSMTH